MVVTGVFAADEYRAFKAAGLVLAQNKFSENLCWLEKWVFRKANVHMSLSAVKKKEIR